MLIVAVMWACGIIASTLGFEIAAFVFPTGCLWILGTDRFPQDKVKSSFYFNNKNDNDGKYHVGSDIMDIHLTQNIRTK